MTEEEKRIVLAVFGTLERMRYEDLNRFMGSETISGMQEMYRRLKYEGYCKRHGLKLEEMTDDDFVCAYEEDHPENGED